MAPALSLTQVRYTTEGLRHGMRLDGRGLLDYRKVELATGFVVQAAGSAQCSLGHESTLAVCVISAESIAAAAGLESENLDLLRCNVDCHASIPMNGNLQALLLTLQKALRQALRSSIDVEQLIILRSATERHDPVRAWQLNVDVTIMNASGGNLADVLFIAVYAALQNVQLPRTRVIKSPIEERRQRTGGGDGAAVRAADENDKMDIFDVRGTLQRTEKAAAADGRKGKADKMNGKVSSTLTEEQWKKCGINFELIDSNIVKSNDSESPAMMGLRDAQSFPIGLTMNLIDEETILLDASAIEEACLSYVRRVLILYNGIKGDIAGTFMIPVSIDLGSQRLGEERQEERQAFEEETFLIGTCSMESINKAISLAVEYAEQFYKSILNKQ